MSHSPARNCVPACCSLTLRPFLVRMYSEALSLRKRRDCAGFEYFATDFQPPARSQRRGRKDRLRSCNSEACPVSMDLRI